MVNGIIGKKLGMTQLFSEDGSVTPVTVIKAGPCIVVQKKTVNTDGYDAVQLGLVEEKVPRRINKPTEGHFKRAGVPPTRVLREVRILASDEATSVGDKILVDMFTEDDLATMSFMRCAFDPEVRFNPGKVFPTRKSCGEAGPAAYRPHPIEEQGLAQRF